MLPELEIIITGSLVAICCSLVGCFLVLRKMAMTGDAISHAVLPGIVIAYLVTGGDRNGGVMLVGAAALGLFTTFMIEFLHRKLRLQQDASIGISFTLLFAIGVILVTAFAAQTDLDQECVLYGEISFTPFERVITAGGLDLGPVSFWILTSVFLIILLFLFLGYKELLITSFDPGYAAAAGASVVVWHYLLMGMVSLTTVASFESVGAILVVAFLIVPPATAYLLTDNFKRMLLLSCFFGILSAVLGYLLAVVMDGSVAGAMSTVAGFFFLLAFLFSPSQGIWRQRFKKAPAVPNEQ